MCLVSVSENGFDATGDGRIDIVRDDRPGGERHRVSRTRISDRARSRRDLAEAGGGSP